MSARGPRYKAMQAGLVRYIANSPCKLGHLGERITRTGTCVECRSITAKKRYHANPEKTKMITAAKYRKNAEKLKQKRKEAYKLNAEKERAIAKVRSAEWRKNNPDHEGNKLAKKKYAKSSKGKARASKNSVIRRTGIKQATPLWVDMADIADVYLEAAYMQMQVDHIVPLRNPLVCGLHVWDNLQLMDAVANNRKGNRYWPDMPA